MTEDERQLWGSEKRGYIVIPTEGAWQACGRGAMLSWLAVGSAGWEGRCLGPRSAGLLALLSPARPQITPSSSPISFAVEETLPSDSPGAGGCVRWGWGRLPQQERVGEQDPDSTLHRQAWMLMGLPPLQP